MAALADEELKLLSVESKHQHGSVSRRKTAGSMQVNLHRFRKTAELISGRLSQQGPANTPVKQDP
jgi:hypothetical protein